MPDPNLRTMRLVLGRDLLGLDMKLKGGFYLSDRPEMPVENFRFGRTNFSTPHARIRVLSVS
jgi:hypothetical protein